MAIERSRRRAAADTGAGSIRSFAPIAAAGARVLILGSMPGERSLAAGQYYAHERNLFWTIMGALIGAGPELSYPARVRRLCANGIALWDVLAACERRGSLDAAIRPDSIRVNAFAPFFRRHPRITHVFFNGGTAERLFLTRVLPILPEPAAGLTMQRLPSTSPAYAAMRAADKLAKWRAVIDRDFRRGNDQEKCAHQRSTSSSDRAAPLGRSPAQGCSRSSRR
jgi:double-stranded uracil-DNA glycosylase